MENKNINIYGKFVNQLTDHYLADAKQIYDESYVPFDVKLLHLDSGVSSTRSAGLFQDIINKDVRAAILKEISDRKAADDALSDPDRDWTINNLTVKGWGKFGGNITTDKYVTAGEGFVGKTLRLSDGDNIVDLDARQFTFYNNSTKDDRNNANVGYDRTLNDFWYQRKGEGRNYLKDLATKTYVNDRVNAIINGAPEAYDTLKEIADYINEDKSVAASLLNAITAEKNRATSAEQMLGSSIDSTNNSLTALRSSLATVAFTGNYTDLKNRPNIFSGDYNDLINKPEIPSVKDVNDLLAFKKRVHFQSDSVDTITNDIAANRVSGNLYSCHLFPVPGNKSIVVYSDGTSKADGTFVFQDPDTFESTDNNRNNVVIRKRDLDKILEGYAKKGEGDAGSGSDAGSITDTNTKNKSVSVTYTPSDSNAAINVAITDSDNNKLQGSATINAVSETQAGIMTPAMYKKLLNANSGSETVVDTNTTNKSLTYDEVVDADGILMTTSVTDSDDNIVRGGIELQGATTKHAGLLTAKDKSKIDEIDSLIATIAALQDRISALEGGDSKSYSINITGSYFEKPDETYKYYISNGTAGNGTIVSASQPITSSNIQTLNDMSITTNRLAFEDFHSGESYTAYTPSTQYNVGDSVHVIFKIGDNTYEGTGTLTKLNTTTGGERTDVSPKQFEYSGLYVISDIHDVTTNSRAGYNGGGVDWPSEDDGDEDTTPAITTFDGKSVNDGIIKLSGLNPGKTYAYNITGSNLDKVKAVTENTDSKITAVPFTDEDVYAIDAVTNGSFDAKKLKTFSVSLSNQTANSVTLNISIPDYTNYGNENNDGTVNTELNRCVGCDIYLKLFHKQSNSGANITKNLQYIANLSWESVPKAN